MLLLSRFESSRNSARQPDFRGSVYSACVAFVSSAPLINIRVTRLHVAAVLAVGTRPVSRKLLEGHKDPGADSASPLSNYKPSKNPQNTSRKLAKTIPKPSKALPQTFQNLSKIIRNIQFCYARLALGIQL
jgi:hypothetical protein